MLYVPEAQGSLPRGLYVRRTRTSLGRAVRTAHRGTTGWEAAHEACGATVHGTYGTPEAGARTPYVECVAPRGKLPCASGTYSTQEAGTRSSYVQYGGSGTYVSAQHEAWQAADPAPHLDD